jgi:hypothetical protein
MKKYLMAVALVVAAASPALAASHKHISRADVAASQDFAYVAPADSITVVSSGKILGRDPDANVRLDLLREGDPSNGGFD